MASKKRPKGTAASKRKAAKRKTAKRKPPRRAAKKGTAKRATAKRASAKKATAKNAAAKRATGRKSRRKSAAKFVARRGRAVAKAVKTKAQQGLEVAKEGLDRLKATTTNLVEEVKERIAGVEGERVPPPPPPPDEPFAYDTR